jgi:hypothetical protein
VALVEHVDGLGSAPLGDGIAVVAHRIDELVGDPEQLVWVDRPHHQVVVAVLLVVEVEGGQAALGQQERHDLLDVDAHRVVTGVDADPRLVAELADDVEALAPVLYVGG